MDFDKLIAYAEDNAIDYTIVGPEDPLCYGIVDKFEAEGLKIFDQRKKQQYLRRAKHFQRSSWRSII